MTRLAPSPTGALHLGNARTFLINWAMARRGGWRILLRIDDLEGPRVKAGADAQAVEDLDWLGLDWDEGPVYQSRRTDRYASALQALGRGGFTYNCRCTRQQVEADSAGRAADGAPIYCGRCRGRSLDNGGKIPRDNRGGASVRFRVPPGPVAFVDGSAGPQSFDATSQLGDFVIRKADGEFGYQLATVVDDADAGVTQVVRGRDLLASTPRQLLLYGALGLEGLVPRHTHLPLVVGPDGRKLGKRHGDTRLRQLRDEGVTPGQVRRLLADWSGFAGGGRPEMGVREWVDGLDLARLPREAAVYDDATGRPVSL